MVLGIIKRYGKIKRLHTENAYVILFRVDVHRECTDQNENLIMVMIKLKEAKAWQ